MKLHVKDKMAGNVTRQLIPGATGMKVWSVWDWECRDKDGNLKWTEQKKNLVMNEGLNALLNVMFGGSTQITAWYIAILETGSTAGTGATYASPTYTECTSYDETARPAFVASTAGTASTALKTISNSHSKAQFTISATKTIIGGALVGGGTAGSVIADTAGGGTLFCSSIFTASKSVVDDDVLAVTITLTSADA